MVRSKQVIHSIIWVSWLLKILRLQAYHLRVEPLVLWVMTPFPSMNISGRFLRMWLGRRICIFSYMSHIWFSTIKRSRLRSSSRIFTVGARNLIRNWPWPWCCQTWRDRIKMNLKQLSSILYHLRVIRQRQSLWGWLSRRRLISKMAICSRSFSVNVWRARLRAIPLITIAIYAWPIRQITCIS